MRGLAQKVTHSRSHQRQRKRPGGRMIEQHERAYVARRARGRVSNPCLPRGHHRTYLHQTPVSRTLEDCGGVVLYAGWAWSTFWPTLIGAVFPGSGGPGQGPRAARSRHRRRRRP
jgi:hypothetical protein